MNEAAAKWQREGWVVIPDLIAAETIDAAVEELWQIYPRPEEFHLPDHPRRRAFLESRPASAARHEVDPDAPAFREAQFAGHRTFPFSSEGKLNRLVVHPHLIKFAEAALGSRDIRLYQAGLWAKYAGAANYSQPFHRDRNHSLVPTRAEPGWWFLEGFLYLNDVDEKSGAPELLRREDAPAVDPGGVLEPGVSPEAYAKSVAAPGRKGSFLAYRGDVWHRAVDLEARGSSRFILIVCFKLAGQDWIGYDPMNKIVDHWRFPTFVANSTPRELEVIGIPAPGHAFWTLSGVEALSLKYPGLDVEPWRIALEE